MNRPFRTSTTGTAVFTPHIIAQARANAQEIEKIKPDGMSDTSTDEEYFQQQAKQKQKSRIQDQVNREWVGKG